MTPTPLRRPLLRGTLALLAVGGVMLGTTTLHGLWLHGFPPTGIRAVCTVAASGLLFVGASAALRNRTWGLLVLLVPAAAFGGVWLLGVAPTTYLAVPLLSGLALALAAPPLGRWHPASLGLALGIVLLVGALAAAVAGPGVDLAWAWFTR